MRNTSLTAKLGRDVWYMDGLDMHPGQAIEVHIESTNAERRQGVRIATEGVLSTNGVSARAIELWADTAPRPTLISCRESTSGRLVLYNIFETQLGRMSQGHTSGMLIDTLPGGGRRYRCCDSAPEPVFDRLVFTVRIR
jgi:hypothetical protein